MGITLKQKSLFMSKLSASKDNRSRFGMIDLLIKDVFFTSSRFSNIPGSMQGPVKRWPPEPSLSTWRTVPARQAVHMESVMSLQVAQDPSHCLHFCSSGSVSFSGCNT